MSDNKSHYYVQYGDDNFCQTNVERMKVHYGAERSQQLSRNSSQSIVDTTMQQQQQQQQQQQWWYQHQQNHIFSIDNSGMNYANSSFNDPYFEKSSPAKSRFVHPPAPVILDNFAADPHAHARRGLHRASFEGRAGYYQDAFARSCPQTEMERLKSRYLKEKSCGVSHDSSDSSIDASGLQQISQNTKSHDSDEEDDVVSLYFDSSFNDLSLDMLSPSNSFRAVQPPPPPAANVDNFAADPEAQVWRGQHRTSFEGGEGYYSGSFARSCPQTEMERLKAEYMKGKSTYLSHNSSHSSIDTQPHQQQQQQQQQQQHIRRYDLDEDDDVLSLNFNAPPLTHASLAKLPQSSTSRVVHPPLPANSDNFAYTNSHARRGLHRTSFEGGGACYSDSFARSCPQTEMERFKAHFMKEKMANSHHFENLQYGSQSKMPHSRPNSFHVHSSKILGVDSGSRDIFHSAISTKGNRMQSPDCSDFTSADLKFGRKSSSSVCKDKNNMIINSHDYKELCNNDLGVISLDVGGAFSSEALPKRREIIFDFVKECKAQIVLMSNTALRSDDQLQLVRAEVKKFFLCESAMWASFFACPDLDKSDEDNLGSAAVAGRGVIILVLGPLAPRTGWIKSDSAGCVISASARIRPNLPVLTFIACDIGGVVEDSKNFNISPLLFLQDLIKTEYNKENLIIIGGNLSGDARKPPAESSCSMTTSVCEWIISDDVNISVVCNSSTPTENFFPEDVLVCQQKRAMSILSVEVAGSFVIDEKIATTSPSLVKLSISGWPKKSFAVQFKANSAQNSDVQSNLDQSTWNQYGGEGSDRGGSASQALQGARGQLTAELLLWQQNLQDFSHNLQGILHANIDKSVQVNCIKQLLVDVLQRAHAGPARIDTPGFANTVHLNRISSLLKLPENELLFKSSVFEQILAGWNSAASYSMTCAASLP